jgi:hypothetical protein
MTRQSRAAALAAVSLALACTVGQKRAAVEKTVEGKPQTREQLFEATLRVLDEHPRYVDEFFALARKHPATLDRFLDDTAEALRDPALAGKTAAALAAHPPGLTQVLVSTLDAAKGKPKAERAIAEAMIARGDLAARAIATRPEAVTRVSEATIDAVANDAAARDAFLAGMRARSGEVAAILATDPKTALAVLGAFLKPGSAGGR